MTQVNIDIPVSNELQQMLNLPDCPEISIPVGKPLKITLPSGDSLQSFTDLSKGIPNDCSMTFSLVLQLAPFLASITCLLRILKLLKPLIDIVKGLPVPPASAVEEFTAAAVDLAPCLLMPAAVLEFAKDIICFIRALLHCLVTQLQSVYNIMSGLQLQIDAAAGNDDLLGSLQCAQKNAQSSVDNLTQAIEPVSALLQLAGPIMSMAGLPSLSLPGPGASPQDLAGLQTLISTLQGVVSAIDEMGICAN